MRFFWLVVLLVVILVELDQVSGYCEQILPSVDATAVKPTAAAVVAGSNSTPNRHHLAQHPHVHIFGPTYGTDYSLKTVSPGHVFTLPKSTLSFEFTCVAAAPVNWRYIGPTVSSPDITFDRGRNGDGTCFYMTMLFPSAVDEITGQYECYQETDPRTVQNFTLFAGNSGNGFLLFRKAGLSLKDTMMSQERQDLRLPCMVNDPNVNVTLWDKIRSGDENWHQIRPEFYQFNPLTGVDVNITALGIASVYKCESEFSRQDAVYISYKAPPDTLVKPDSEFLTLPANKTSLVLECYAMVPVQFSNTNLSDQTAAADGTRYGYKYGASMTLNFDGRVNGTRFGNWNISCINADTTASDGGVVEIIHSWEIQFATQNFTPGLVFDPATSTATCFSQAPGELTLYYVLCELLTHCQFLQPCLEPSQDWMCPENLAKNPKQLASNETSITVQLQDFSGALTCVGVDVNQTIYVHRTAINGKLNLDDNQSDLVAINLVGNSEIHLGSVVHVECIASKRFFVNNLTFQLWSGDSIVKLLTKEYMSASDNSLIAGMYIHRIQFKMMNYNVDQITCVAPRYDGNSAETRSVHVKVKKKGPHPSPGPNWTAIALAVTAAVFLIVVLIVMYFWRATKAKAAAAAAAAMNVGVMLSDMEFELLQRFREGSPQHVKKGDKDKDKELDDLEINRAGDEYLNIVEDGHYYAQMIPYNTNEHEIALNKLQIDRKEILGIGEYGIVYKGVYDNGTFGVPVAIKELKPNAQYVYLKALLAEIKIMIYVDKHENIVEFLGACTRSRLEACIVLRLYPYGTLEKYLRDHRQTLAYQNVAQIRAITNAGSGYVNPTELCVNDLIRWSLQIASALEYLFFKKVIHGDLATRNVLLDETLTAKVSDFGLARQRYTDYDFPKLCDMPLPWRWMSIESLRYLDFTQQSDLWSFGVTMWEIFSLAEIPYIGQRLSSSFLNDLENGVRLERPANASEELYDLMKECWITNPKDRITVHEVKRKLDVIVANAAATGGASEPINYRQIEFRETEE